MKIQRRKIDTSIEKKILRGAIVSSRYLRELQIMYKSEFMRVDAIRVLMNWCFEYFKHYETAPAEHIRDMYEQIINDGGVDENVKLVGIVLDELKDDISRIDDKFNVDYLLDETQKFFNKRGLEILVDDIKMNLNNNDLDAATASFNSYKPAARVQVEGINPVDDAEIIKKAYESGSEPLFELHGVLGSMMNPWFVRGGFIGIMGPEKSGKSYFLLELAMQAHRQRCNVVIFDAGDMVQDDWVMRIQSYITRYPKPYDIRGRKYIDVPVVDCKKNYNNRCRSKERRGDVGYGNFSSIKSAIANGYKLCTVCGDIEPFRLFEKVRITEARSDWSFAFRNGQRWQKRTKKKFRLSCHFNNTLTLRGIENILDTWEYFDGFVPDVIITDYADIMTTDDFMEERHKQNHIWKGLRAMSQKKRCLVITATQTAARSYGKKKITKSDFSEDKRKYGHVTRMYAISQTEEEEKINEVRIGEVVAREGRRKLMQVAVVQCLDVSRFHMGSYISKDTKEDE